MILLGLVLGRWPRTALVVAALGWPALLLATGVLGQSSDPLAALAGAAFLATVNAGAGVLAHQGVLLVVRRIRGDSSRRVTPADGRVPRVPR